jgi:hypothetical protein
MKKHIIGLDFGTSQTKICTRIVTDHDNTFDVFVLHKFSQNNKYILPTAIGITSDGTLICGENAPQDVRNFKMKSLFWDDDLYKVHIPKYDHDNITQEDLGNMPELCTILYLAYCILDVKRSFNDSSSVTQDNDQDDILKRLFEGKTRGKAEFNYSVTLGIPTEFQVNIEEHRRRCKHIQMLYFANELAKRQTGGLDQFNETSVNTLISVIKELYNEPFFRRRCDKLKFYLDANLFIMAETTAGIYFFLNQLQRTRIQLTNQDQINRFGLYHYGNYITFDIGAGTTDVSFFSISETDGVVSLRYFATKSITVACNKLFLNYLGPTASLDDIYAFHVMKIDQDKWREAQLNIREQIFYEIRDPENRLFESIRNQFVGNVRENWDVEFDRAKGIKVFGGGSYYSEFSEGIQLLHNGGVMGYQPAVQIYSNYTRLFDTASEVFFNVPIKNPDGTNISDMENISPIFPILNLSIGLSMVDGFGNQYGLQTTVYWNPETEIERFDVFGRKWI